MIAHGGGGDEIESRATRTWRRMSVTGLRAQRVRASVAVRPMRPVNGLASFAASSVASASWRSCWRFGGARGVVRVSGSALRRDVDAGKIHRAPRRRHDGCGCAPRPLASADWSVMGEPTA